MAVAGLGGQVTFWTPLMSGRQGCVQQRAACWMRQAQGLIIKGSGWLIAALRPTPVAPPKV